MMSAHEVAVARADARFSGPRTNLPVPLTRFVGRSEEIGEISRLLGTARLVTLLGPAGCGKTRLCLEVAARVAPHYPGGAWFVQLDTISDPDLIGDLVAAAALGTGGSLGTLVLGLQNRHVLVVLDNCEHLADACAGVASTLLEACARLTLLTTSRRSLGLAGEVVCRVGPLPLPPPDTAAPEPVLQAEAAQLFLDRAGLHPPGVEPTDRNLRAVARICQRLDGLPLAITLAAGWVRVLSVDEIEDRLSDRLDLLVHEQGHPRHRSLRAAFAWSYRLLSPAQRAVFRSLATFSGDFDLEAAEAVCSEGAGSGRRVLHALAPLVDASMLVRPSAGRYRLLESLREYAAELSREAGEVDAAGRRHLDYYLAMVRRASGLFSSPEAGPWLARLEVEHSNISAALAWSQEHAPGALMEMATRLASFWHHRNHQEEGIRWLEAAISRLPSDDPHLRANVLDVIASLTLDLDPGVAVDYAEESLRAALESRRPDAIVQAMIGRSRVARQLGDAPRALAFSRRALARAREWGNDQSIAWATHAVAESNLLLGNLRVARRYGEIVLRLAEDLANPLLGAAARITLAHGALAQEQWSRARDLLVESLRLQEEHALVFPLVMASVLDLLALVEVAFEEPVRALRLGGAAEAVLLSAGRTPSPFHRRVRDEWIRRATSMVGARRADLLRREGGAAPVDHVLRYARYVDRWRLPLKSGQDRRYVQVGSVILTRRERELAVLVAQGRSNQEIADGLVLSRRTVEGHLDRLRHKLSVRTRAQIAVWVATAGLAEPSKSGTPGAEIR